MGNPSTDLHEAVRLHQQGELDRAAAIYRQVLQSQPQQADARHLLGVIAHQRGEHEKAVELIQSAIDLVPNSAAYHNNLGAALREIRQIDAAAESFARAVELDPQYVEARYNLGNAQQACGQLDEAAATYRAVLGLAPQHTQTLNNLGAVLQTQGDLAGATECYQQVLALDSRHAESWHNLGLCCDLQDRLTEAEQFFRRALECRPNFLDAYNSLGSALRVQGRVAEARQCFEHVLERNPQHRLAQSNVLMALDYLDDASPQEIAARRWRWGDEIAAQIRPRASHDNSAVADRPLKIGYVSPDFREHAVARFIEPILSHHGEEFAVYCYSDVPVADAVTRRLAGLADEWRDVYGMADERLEQCILNDGVDILVDLTGHTAGNRLRVFARKPAPVQVTYLGDSTTTGLAAIDYRLSDVWADPWFVENHCREELIRLPGGFLCYQPTESAPDVAELPAEKHGYITFGSLNSLAKITSAVMDLWAELLRQVPESRLCLKNGALRDDQIRKRVAAQFAERGVAENRLDLRGHVEQTADHLSLYNEIDIGLDPFPYAGTTTTCEALWMGVPVVTLPGQSHVSRVGVSLLSQVGLNELVARDAANYVRIAANLAGDRERLATMRSGLRAAVGESSLCDAVGFTRQLESVYRTMWRRWCATQQRSMSRAG